MKPSSTKERLQIIMDERKLRQTDILQLAKPYCEKYQIRLHKNDISQYVTGKVEPKQDKLTVLSRALDVNEAWLMGYDVPRERSIYPTNIQPMPAVQRVPRLGSIACGEPILAEQNIEGYDTVPDYVKCDFTLICKGDSMINARIYDGDIVCIKQQPRVENGQIAAVLVDDEATLKRVRYIDGGVALMPENNKYEPLIFTGEAVERVRIIGLATHFISTVN